MCIMILCSFLILKKKLSIVSKLKTICGHNKPSCLDFMGTQARLFPCIDVRTNFFVLWPVQVVDGGLNVELPVTGNALFHFENFYKCVTYL